MATPVKPFMGWHQPYLELQIKGGEVDSFSDSGVLFIEVEGKIDDYITEDNDPSPKLVELCKRFAKSGVVVMRYSRYVGSGGPSHLLRNDRLCRIDYHFGLGLYEILSYEYRVPEYSGPKKEK